MIRRLESKSLVNYMKHHDVRLTEEGRRHAEKIVEAHELIRKFLIAIGVDEEKANTEAELIEHFPSEETLQRLRLVYEKRIKNCKL